MYLCTGISLFETELTVTELVECHCRGKNMREKLKETFPEKSGEESGWKFGKFHAVEHCVVTILHASSALRIIWRDGRGVRLWQELLQLL